MSAVCQCPRLKSFHVWVRTDKKDKIYPQKIAAIRTCTACGLKEKRHTTVWGGEVWKKT